MARAKGAEGRDGSKGGRGKGKRGEGKGEGRNDFNSDKKGRGLAVWANYCNFVAVLHPGVMWSHCRRDNVEE